MKALCIDVETTTHNTGSWIDSRNSLVMLACYDGSQSRTYLSGELSKPSTHDFLGSYDIFVGFNIKFDLHWLKNVGIDLTDKHIIDVQLLEYFYSRQQNTYPSLNDISKRYLNKEKHDIIKIDYWDQGIQTDEIPTEILANYAIQDVKLTWENWQYLSKKLKPSQEVLFQLANQDLICLFEMERQGLKYNREGSLALAKEQDNQIQQIRDKFNIQAHVPNFNWASGDHLSALLYGGTINETLYVPNGHYKTGKRIGQVKLSKQIKTHHLPRQYTPIKDSELAKKGFWSTDEDTLLKLHGKKRELLDGILKIKKLAKDNSTYLRGLPKRQDEGFYAQDMIYGSFNQSATNTGRLSSTKPNLQNLSDNALQFFESRYD